MRKILSILIVALFIVSMVACGPSAEQVTATKVMEDVTASASGMDGQTASKATTGTLDASLFNNGGSGSIDYSIDSQGEWDADLGDESYSSQSSVELSGSLTYNDFKFASDSTYTLNGDLDSSLKMASGIIWDNELFSFKFIFEYTFNSTEFTAVEGETTHNLEMSSIGINGSIDFTATQNGLEITSSIEGSGDITVDGVVVSGSSLNFDAENSFEFLAPSTK